MISFADAETVHRLLDFPTLIESFRCQHQEALPATHLSVVGAPGRTADLLVAHLGWGPRIIASKVVTVVPDNAKRSPPLPSVQGLVIIADAGTGAPLLVVDGAALTQRKTAADSALAASYLARPDSRRLLVVGAGALAPHVADALCAVLPNLEEILIWNRTPARASALATRLNAKGGPRARQISDLDAAVPLADVISTMTMTEVPLIRGALLSPGTHLDLIGSYLPTMREADDDAISRSDKFADIFEDDAGSGEFSDPIARGVMAPGELQGDLFDLCQSRSKGRERSDQITLFKNFGGGHLDLFAADCLIQCFAAKAGQSSILRQPASWIAKAVHA